jgi:succinoglycan biosynthesis transport protein ExoP
LNQTVNNDEAVLPDPEESASLTAVFHVLNRRKLLIAAVTLCCLVATGVYTWRQPNRYEAICRLDIDLTPPKTSLGVEDSGSASSPTEQKMATQLGIINSQSVAWDVIVKLRLDRNPTFSGSIAGPERDPQTIPDVFKFALIRRFQSALSVQFERGTEIAQIHYSSVDPRLASTIANTIAQTYIERNFQTKYKTAHVTSVWLNGQLETLREQVVSAEQEFADFQKKTGLLQTDDTHNTISERINQLNIALSTAQTARILKEVSLGESASPEPDQVMPPGALSTLLSLRTQLSSLKAQYALLTPKYGDAYPRVIELKSQMKQVQSAIDEQIRRGREQLASEYQAALTNEHNLQAAVEDQKRQVFALNETALQYSILQRKVISDRSLYEDLTRRLQEAQITSGLSADALAIIDPALVPNIPTEPRKRLNLEIGLAAGFLIGVALAFLVENLNVTVRTIEDVTLHSRLPVLGLVPHVSAKDFIGNQPDQELPNYLGPRVLANSQTHFAEAFRSLRSALLLSSAGSPPQVIMICSSWPNEGKSTVAINLAMVFAQLNKRVLLVDADLRRPTLHTKLDLKESSIGLSGLLTTGERLDISSYVISGVGDRPLDFLPAGRVPPSPTELLLSERMGQLIEEWRTSYDFIVMDTAPVLAVSDTSGIVALADTTLLVVRSDSTKRNSLKAFRETVQNVRGKIAGVLLNDVKTSSTLYAGYYGGKRYYGDYYSKEKDS